MIAENSYATNLIGNGRYESNGLNQTLNPNSFKNSEEALHKGKHSHSFLQRFGIFTMSYPQKSEKKVSAQRRPSDQLDSIHPIGREIVTEEIVDQKKSRNPLMAMRNGLAPDEEQEARLDFQSSVAGGPGGQENKQMRDGILSPRVQSPVDFNPSYASIKNMDFSDSVQDGKEKISNPEERDEDIAEEVGFECLSCLGQGIWKKAFRP